MRRRERDAGSNETPGAIFVVMLLFVVLLVLLAASPSHAQIERVYRVAPAYNGRIDTLRMHVWPSLYRRLYNPLMVVVHGGAFMSGSYRDLDSTCKRYAERGYVAVTVQYRLGFYSPPLLDPPYTYDRAEIVRACWRGVQDVRAAVRYLIDSAQMHSIDTSCITIGGVSAGAVVALQATIADASDSIPIEVHRIGDVQRGFDFFPRPDLGQLHDTSTTHDTSTLHDTSSRPFPTINSVVNYFGAIMHPYMLDARRFPSIISYHQRNDPVVACGTRGALWGLPLNVGANWPVLSGSCALDELLEGGGHDATRRVTYIHDGNVHDVHDATLIDSIMNKFLAVHSCDRMTSVDDETATANTSASGSLMQPCDGCYDRAHQWIAFDVMGRELARGNQADTPIEQFLPTHFNGVVFVVMHCGERILYLEKK